MITREEFLERRRSGIGGSDVAAILGISKWKTAIDVWRDKTGRNLEPDEETECQHFGTVLENIVAVEFARRNNKKVQRRNQMFRHKEHPELIANIDRYIVGGGLLECKTANAFTRDMWGECGTDKVPEYYLTQVLHYMSVTGIHEANLAVLIGGSDYRDYEVSWDAELAEFIEAKCLEFWQKYVLTGTQPPPTIQDDFNRLFHPDDNLIVQSTPEIMEKIERLKSLKEQTKEMDNLKKEIQLFMGNATVIMSGEDKIATWKKQKDTFADVTDWERLSRAWCPDLESEIPKFTESKLIRRGARTFSVK